MNINSVNSPRLGSLQALRAISFLAILAYHCGILPTGPWAVTIFFVLSGFVMYYSQSKKQMFTHTLRSGMQLTVRRIAKLYPLHVIMMLVIIFRENIGADVVSLDWLKISANCLLITSWIPPQCGITPYNGVAWYLSTSVFLYFCSETICSLLSRASLRKTRRLMIGAYGCQVIFICGLVGFSGLSEEIQYWLSYEFPLFRLGDFFSGCCLAKLFIDGKSRDNHLTAELWEVLCIVFVAVCLAIYTLKRGFLGSDPVRRSVLLLPSAAATVYLFAQKRGKITDLLTNRALIWLAKISPYGFLIHQEIIYQSKYYLFGPGAWQSVVHKVVVLFVAFAVTVLLSVIYDRTINRKEKLLSA